MSPPDFSNVTRCGCEADTSGRVIPCARHNGLTSSASDVSRPQVSESSRVKPSQRVPVDFSMDDQGIRYGTVGVPLERRREPTQRDFDDPRFEVIWELIKRVDVDFRNGLFSGATGNDVCAVLDALDAVRPPSGAKVNVPPTGGTYDDPATWATAVSPAPQEPRELLALVLKWREKADRFDAEAQQGRGASITTGLEWEASRLRDCASELLAQLTAVPSVQVVTATSVGKPLDQWDAVPSVSQEEEKTDQGLPVSYSADSTNQPPEREGQ